MVYGNLKQTLWCASSRNIQWTTGKLKLSLTKQHKVLCMKRKTLSQNFPNIEYGFKMFSFRLYDFLYLVERLRKMTKKLIPSGHYIDATEHKKSQWWKKNKFCEKGRYEKLGLLLSKLDQKMILKLLPWEFFETLCYPYGHMAIISRGIQAIINVTLWANGAIYYIAHLSYTYKQYILEKYIANYIKSMTHEYILCSRILMIFLRL